MNPKKSIRHIEHMVRSYAYKDIRSQYIDRLRVGGVQNIGVCVIQTMDGTRNNDIVNNEIIIRTNIHV